MNAKQLIAAAALISATGAVFAQSTEFVRPDENFVSTKTRAEVMAELKQARIDGLYAVGGEEYPNQVLAASKTVRSQVAAAPAPVSGKTRAEVIAELQQARAEGYAVGGEEFPNQVPVLAKGIRVRGEAIESAQIKKPVSAPTGGQ